jgi:hypothetical protein
MTWNGRASACLLASLVVSTGSARALERDRDSLAARERVTSRAQSSPVLH